MGKERKTSSRKVARRVKVVEDGHEKKKPKRHLGPKMVRKAKIFLFFFGVSITWFSFSILGMTSLCGPGVVDLCKHSRFSVLWGATAAS